MNDSPAQLVAAIAAGSRDAETQLVERFDAPLLELLLARSGDRQLAEDLRQDTLQIVIERLRDRGIENPEKLPAFVCQTARNLLIAHKRKLARRKTTSDTTVVELQQARQDTASDTYDKGQIAQAIDNLLDELRQERDRDILRRFYVMDQPKPDICAALDLSTAHFDRVLHRARQRFKTLLQRKGIASASMLNQS